MLKPSFKSIEGQSVYAVVLGAMVLLYELFTGSDASSISIDTIMQQAESAKELASAYQLSNIGEGWGTAKVAVILAFVYKIYTRFTDSRTELKKKEMEMEELVEVSE